MQSTFYKKDKQLVFEMEEEIDEYSAQNIKRRMDWIDQKKVEKIIGKRTEK